MIDPDANTCKVTLDLPWEVIDALVEHGPALLRLFERALLHRAARDDRRSAERSALARDAASNFAAWEKMYDEYRALLRGANCKGQSPLFKRQVALAHGVPVGDMSAILSLVFKRRNQARKKLSASARSSSTVDMS